MTGGQQAPTSAAGPTAAAGGGGYPDYNRMSASQAGQPGAAAGAPHVDSSGAPDYSVYGEFNIKTCISLNGKYHVNLKRFYQQKPKSIAHICCRLSTQCTETIDECLWPQMDWVRMDCNSKQLG